MPRSRVIGEWVGLLVVSALAGVLVSTAALALQSSRAPATPYRDAIFSCLERNLLPAYGVGKDGPPKPGQVLTAEMITIICVEDR